jgi:hypothetical protein
MTYIPKLAYELQSFKSISDMNQHMNYHFAALKDQLTKSNDAIFHLIKKFACKVAGVCWLKQESLASFADVSVKTVELAIKFLKENGVIKIFHTKRLNGLNGNCYYVLQPFEGEVEDEEEIVILEEENVGAGEVLETYETPTLKDHQTTDKLFISSSKALESSLKTKEEEIIYTARVLSNINNINNIKEHVPTIRIKPEDYLKLVNHLTDNRFLDKVARKITDSVLKAFPTIQPIYIMRLYEKAFSKLQKRLTYPEPILSIVDYYMSLVWEELNHVRDSFYCHSILQIKK